MTFVHILHEIDKSIHRKPTKSNIMSSLKQARYVESEIESFPHNKGVTDPLDGDVSGDASASGATSSGDTLIGVRSTSSGDAAAAEMRSEQNRGMVVRALILLSFLTVATLVPIVVYRNLDNSERQSLTNEFDVLASRVASTVEDRLALSLDAIDGLDIALISYVVGNPADNSTSETVREHPFVSLPDFDLQSANTIALAKSFGAFLIPRVDVEDRMNWEAYALANAGWIEESMTRGQVMGGSISRRRLQEPLESIISEEIFQYDEQGNVISSPPPPEEAPYYFPLWQHNPVDPGAVNFNMIALESLGPGMVEMVNKGMAVLNKVLELSSASDTAVLNFLNEMIASTPNGADRNPDEPVSAIVYPVFPSVDEKDKVVSSLLIPLDWASFFRRVLPESSNGVVCVVENACDQAFTYRIDGKTAIFEGYGDLHSANFNGDRDYIRVVNINEDVAERQARVTAELSTDFCPYQMRIYPSPQLEDEYLTFQPALFAFLTAFIFFMIFLTAVAYDWLVQRRLKAAIASAMESGAVVSSLFPKQFREQLMKSKKGEDPNKKDRVFGEKAEKKPIAIQPAKQRLKSIINDDAQTKEAAAKAELGMLESRPIADLFPNCTVLYADIAGFTAWSSEREPAQVFTLLQTIFHHFDTLARKWGVFKVETIGDCYVAVTGLPDPQNDHAVRITKFAREALRKVSELVHELEVSLGPDTGELSMRFGLHSGPVTAGVLRGEKSRFQLFGDTVNTAARVENTGKRGAIQVSQATADLLKAGGKEEWLVRRDDLISAKGAGQIQTYWVKVHTVRDTDAQIGMDPFNPSGRHSFSDPSAEMKTRRHSSVTIPMQIGLGAADKKLRRLIDWQTELLARLLQQIIAQRDRNIAAKFVADPLSAIDTRGSLLDEVAEIIVPPSFEERAKNVVDPKSVEISPAVMSQLREYVSIIASKYNDNPFHNFDHASHVTMSASKLLSRIVVPESVDYDRENKKDIAADLHDNTYGITSDPLTQFAAIFCSLIHDVDHQGISNFQLGTEQPDMAEKYRNRSLAEQNSIDIAWDILMQPEFRSLQQAIFSTVSELARFRQLLVNLVLATDIFDKDFKTLRNSRWDRAFHSKSEEEGKDEELFNLKSTIVIEHIIQAADVAHTMQHWHVYTKWNERLFFEMYRAYENGRMAKDPSEGWYKGELWFFDNYVIPLGKKLDECNVFGVASDEGLNYALQNRAEWEIKGDEIVKEMLKKYQELNPPKTEKKRGKKKRRFSLGKSSEAESLDSK